MVVLDGKMVSAKIREQISVEVNTFKMKSGKTPGLAVIIVGDDPASHAYVKNKEKACAAVGIRSMRYDLPHNATAESLHKLIEKLNDDPSVHGILIQLPLPKHLDTGSALELVRADKDADCFAYSNIGLLYAGEPKVIPCTPHGVMAVLKHYSIELSGRHAVVVGRSNIVGKPMAQLLLRENATVTICHSKTKDLSAITRQGDIVVVAAGRPRLLGKDDFKKGAIIVDVGMHKLEPKGWCGDVRFEELEGWAAAATPVPGGIGPMTITMLLKNTLSLARTLEGISC